jgi:hypothetical protein
MAKTRISRGPTNANRPGGLKGMLPRRKPMSESDYMEKIKGLEEKVQKLTDRARPTGLTRQSEKYGKRPKAKPMTYSPGKRKAISDFITGRPNISTRKINTILSSKINKPGGMGMGTKSKSNTPGGMGVPNKRVLQKALTSANINRGKIGEREKLMLERRKKLKDEGYYTVTDKDGNKRVKRK